MLKHRGAILCAVERRTIGNKRRAGAWRFLEDCPDLGSPNNLNVELNQGPSSVGEHSPSKTLRLQIKSARKVDPLLRLRPKVGCAQI